MATPAKKCTTHSKTAPTVSSPSKSAAAAHTKTTSSTISSPSAAKAAVQSKTTSSTPSKAPATTTTKGSTKPKLESKSTDAETQQPAAITSPAPAQASSSLGPAAASAAAAALESEIALKAINSKLESSFAAHKYQLLFDTTGNCEVFLSYRANTVVIDVAKLCIGISLGKTSQAEAIEVLRKAAVHGMLRGCTLVLNCGKICVDFKTLFNDPHFFPTDKLFDFKEWRKEGVFQSIAKPEEYLDSLGQKTPFFILNESFTVIVLQSLVDSADPAALKAQVKDKIPHLNAENFDVAVVN